MVRKKWLPILFSTTRRIFVNVNSSSSDRRVNVSVDRAWKNDETLVKSPVVRINVAMTSDDRSALLHLQ